MSRKFTSWPDWQIAATVTAGLRVFYSAMAAALMPFLHPDAGLIESNGELTRNLPSPHGVHYALVGIWQRFDTLWYLRIAEHGYDRPMAVIFYPLYPAAIRLVSGFMPAMAAALVVSTVAAFFFFWGLLRLAGELSEAGKLRTLLFFCVWPTSFILFAGYAESLTLALLVWTVVFGRCARWEAATVCGLLAGWARPSGVLIFIPLAMLALRSRQARSLVVALTPLSLLSYWGWLRWSGRTSVVDAYRMWNTEVASPWTTLWQTIASLTKHFDSLVMISLVAVIFFFIAGVAGRRRAEDRCFSAAVIVHILLRLCMLPLLGTPRYLLAAYPAYLTMGEWAEKMKRARFVFVCSVLFVFNLVWMWAFLSWSLVL